MLRTLNEVRGQGQVQMRPIEFTKGDATAPPPEGSRIIAHICNDAGKWGKGFVLAVSRRWPEAEAAYRRWYDERCRNDFGLGAVQFVRVEPEVWVANMVGQHGTARKGSKPPIQYDAVRDCLWKLAEKAGELNASVHMPRIGCGLAGGKWEMVEPIIVETLCANGVAVTVYDL